MKETEIYLSEKNLSSRYKEDISRLWSTKDENVSLLNLRLPCVLHIEYTYECPLQCKYCYAASSPKRKDQMPFDTFKHIIDKINKEDVFGINMLGGDPFITPKYMQYLLETIQNKFITITTNGILLKEDHCKWIKKSKNKVCVSLGVDGHTAEIHNSTRGGFDKLCASIELLNKYKIPIVATTCVTRHNYEHLEKIIQFLINNNFHAVQVLPVETSHLNEKIRDELSIKEIYPEVLANIKKLVEEYEDRIRFEITFEMPLHQEKTCNSAEILYGPCTAGLLSAGINNKGNLVICPPVQVVQIPIRSSIEDSFKELKNIIDEKRQVITNKKKVIIPQCCDIFEYGQKVSLKKDMTCPTSCTGTH